MECVLISIINKGKILLQLRDEIPSILNPGCWAIPGGAVEMHETIYEAAYREFNEEIVIKDRNIDNTELELCGNFRNDNGVDEYVFLLTTCLDDDNFMCTEGQGGNFFYLNDLPIKLAPHHLQAIAILNQHLNQNKGEQQMQSVKDYLTIEKLNIGRNLVELHNGKGCRYESENSVTAFYHNGDPMRYLAYIEFSSNKARGNHYHKNKFENMCVISGIIHAQYCLPDKPEEIFKITLNPGDIIRILPGCAHSYISIEGANAVEYSPQNFDNADTVDFILNW